jgi:hypothetical protein
MDALLVDGADDEAGDALVSLEEEGNISHKVFDKDRIVVPLHGDVAFILGLEERIRRGVEADLSALSTSSEPPAHDSRARNHESSC